MQQKMAASDRERLLEIRKRGKLGRVTVTDDEHAFCTEMYERFPKEYADVETEMIAWLRGLSWWELI